MNRKVKDSPVENGKFTVSAMAIGAVRAKRILLKVEPAKITGLHALVEACDYLAVVRTLDPEIAVVEMIATPDTVEKSLELARFFERRLGAEILTVPG